MLSSRGKLAPSWLACAYPASLCTLLRAKPQRITTDQCPRRPCRLAPRRLSPAREVRPVPTSGKAQSIIELIMILAAAGWASRSFIQLWQRETPAEVESSRNRKHQSAEETRPAAAAARSVSVSLPVSVTGEDVNSDAALHGSEQVLLVRRGAAAGLRNSAHTACL